MIIIKATAICDGTRYGIRPCEDKASCEIVLWVQTQRLNDNDDSCIGYTTNIEIQQRPDDWLVSSDLFATRCPACIKKDLETTRGMK